MTIRHHIILTILAALLSAVAFSSCDSDGSSSSQDPDQPGVSGIVTFRINAAPLGNVSSRATDNFSDPDLAQNDTKANELINNWVVAFFRDNQVMAVVDGKPGTGGTSGASGAWNDRVRLELPRGTYSAIAFANLDLNKIKARLENLILETDWKNHIYDEDLAPIDNSLIPMSGYLENFTVRGTVNEEFAIEVVRMKAKIEYVVKNRSSQKIDVQSFLFTPVYTGPIYLFPEYDKKPVPDTQSPANYPRIPALADDAPDPYITVNEQASNDFKLEPNSETVKRGNFYIKESVAVGNHPTDHFHIGLKIKRGDEAVDDVTYALADDELKFIYRNDYILFPIVISDYVPEFEVFDYPPIGGYPVSLRAENNEFYATFSYSGTFDLKARLRNSQGDTVAIDPYDGSGAQTNYVRFVGSDHDDFMLSFDPATVTWQGYFSVGSKHITLIFEFKIDNLIYTRTLHLISK